jgi:hypothetical protein
MALYITGRLGTCPQVVISEEQSAEVALAVKNVGQRLSLKSDRNGYAMVYSKLYRRFGVSSYRDLSRSQHREALTWLHGWYKELVEDKEE